MQNTLEYVLVRKGYRYSHGQDVDRVFGLTLKRERNDKSDHLQLASQIIQKCVKINMKDSPVLPFHLEVQTTRE